MHEHPPGYEAEQPIDLSRAVRPDEQVSDDQLGQRGPLRTQQRAAPAGALAVAIPGSWLTVVANVKPGTFKTTTVRMLEAVISPVRDDIRFLDGVGHPVPGLAVADSASDLSGTRWRPGVQAADQLVIPVPDEIGAVRAANWMLDGLESDGRSDLTANAITVVIRTGRDRRLTRQSRAYFGRRTAEVVEIAPRKEDPSCWVPLAAALLRRLADRSAASANGSSGPVIPLDSHQQKAVS